MGNICCLNYRIVKVDNEEAGSKINGGLFTATNEDLSPSPPSRPTEFSDRIVVAVSDFRALEETDVSFAKGDRMVLLDISGGDWWRIKHLRTGKAGLVPRNHVAEEVSVESEDLFGISISGESPFSAMGNICCLNYRIVKVDNEEAGSKINGGLFTATNEDLSPSPPSRPTEFCDRIVVAVSDFRALEETDVSFVKGDRMVLLDISGGDWWRIKHLRTGKAGLVPRNHVAEEVSVESEDWFFVDISRKDTYKLLMMEENPRGTFLVRKSEHIPNGYSLSIKDWEEGRGYHVKHYKVKSLESGGYYIATSHTFPTLQSLITSYHVHDHGLCYTLVQPCPKPKPQMWDLSSEHQDHWEIDRSELEFIREVGRGHFGVVWYGAWRQTTEVAIKQLKEGSMSTEAFLEEAAIMKKFRHCHLVALYAVCSQDGPICLVQEFLCNGSLLDYLRHGDGRYLQIGDLVHIAAQVASGMAYLEGMQLIHRDIAARNVLIGENNVAKICDFGLARVIEDDEYCPKQGKKFPVKWTAPEAIMYTRFTIKSDVWSYGILLMELFTYGQVPYPGMSNNEVMDQLEKGYRMQKPVTHVIPDSIYESMLQCWDADPQRRPTFEYLYQFYEDFNISSEGAYRDVEDS